MLCRASIIPRRWYVPTPRFDAADAAVSAPGCRRRAISRTISAEAAPREAVVDDQHSPRLSASDSRTESIHSAMYFSVLYRGVITLTKHDYWSSRHCSQQETLAHRGADLIQNVLAWVAYHRRKGCSTAVEVRYNEPGQG